MWLALAAFAGGMQIVTGINEVLGLQSTAALFADLSIVPGLWLAFGFLLGVAFPESWTASLASIQLAIRTRFRTPLRLMAFAEDAREREVLRTVGPIYQFRHRHLQELLTAQSSPKVSALRLRTARNALRSVAAKLQRGGSVAAFRWAGPVQPALAVGAVTAATYWLGQGFVYPDLWGTRIGAATTLVAGFGAGLGAVMSQSEVDGTDARWAFLFRPGLVFGLGTVLAFNLAANIGRSFLTTFWLQDATKGLPFAVALWLVLGLGAAAIRTRGGQQLLKVWHKVHENLPLVFVVGLGVGWIGEGYVVAVIPGTEMTVHGEVVTAGARNGLISTIAAGSVALGFLLILAFAPLPARKADSDTASSIEKPGRLTRLLLWAVAGSLLANILTRDVIRAFYLSGSESMAGAWLVTLVLTLLPGYVLGLVFPRIQPPDTAGAAPQPGNANPEPG
jgi:hypothetical protein